MAELSEAQRIAVVQAKAAFALIEALGMQAANQTALMQNKPPSYEQHHFDALGSKYGLGVNQIKLYLQGLAA